MFRQKKKIIILLFTVIFLICSCFGFSVSALTESKPTYYYYDSTTGSDFGNYITKYNGIVENMVTFEKHNSAVLDKPFDVCYSLSPAGIFEINGAKSFTFSLKFNTDKINIGSGQMWTYSTRIYFRTTVNKTGYYPDTVVVQNCNVDFIDENGKIYSKSFSGDNHSYIDINSGLMSDSFSGTTMRITLTAQTPYTLKEKAMLFYFADSVVSYGTSGEFDKENEKQEATDTGADGVGDISSVIPDDTQALTTAFKKLTASMTHTNTTAKLNFPGIKIPALKPFTDTETVLLGEQEINFEEYIKLIPDKILLLVQSLGTIALILFCFKELYSQISYVLTLRGGGADE